MAARYSVEAIFKAVDRITAPITRMQARVSRFTRSMRRGFARVGTAFATFGRLLRRGVQVATVAVFGLGFAISNVVNAGADFERSVGAAAAKFPGQIQRGTAAFEELKDASREVGRTTEFTATQSAAALEFFAKAGYTAEFSIQALKPSVDFATATLTEFDRAADIASDTLGAFGLNVDNTDQKMRNYQRVLDVVTATTASANVDTENFFEAVKQGGPALSAAGGDLETFSAIVGKLGDVGIKGSLAGVAVKNIANALAGEGNQAASMMRRLGISTTDASGNIRDQLDVLEELGAKLGTLEEGERFSAIRAIFGLRTQSAASAMLQLITQNSGALREYRQTLYDALGVTERTATFIRGDVRGSLDSLKSAIESVKLSIFDMNEGGIKRTIDRMTAWVRANEQLIAQRVGDWLERILEWFNDGGWDRFVNFVKTQILPTFEALFMLLKGIADLIGWIVKQSAESQAYGAWWEGQQSGRNFGEQDPRVIATGSEYVARSIMEQRETNSAELLIRDETGRGEVRGGLGPRISLVHSGAFN